MFRFIAYPESRIPVIFQLETGTIDENKNFDRTDQNLEKLIGLWR